ncbi:MAG: hypothetical protein ACRDL5_11990, partial [Solirubrobacteraceae bacterium]
MRRAALLACYLAPALALATAISVPVAAAGTARTTRSGGQHHASAVLVLRAAAVTATGELIVDFHGDVRAGCVKLGVWAYSGWVSWQPSTGGLLDLSGYRSGRRLEPVTVAGSASAQDLGLPGSLTSAAVARAGADTGPCLDSTQDDTDMPLPLHRNRLSFDLGETAPSILSNRCAGPRAPEIGSLLPARRLSLAALAQAGQVVSLAATRSFSVHGFAGTVRSTIVFRVGRLGAAQKIGAGLPARGSRRYRELDVSYRARRSGAVVESFKGDPHAAICAELDSCAATGAASVELKRRSGRASLAFLVPASVPASRLLAAAGIGRGRRPSVTGGSGELPLTGGEVQTVFRQGANVCRDTTRLGASTVLLSLSGAGVEVQYVVPGRLQGPGFWGTVCPGPSDGAGILAVGRSPAAALRRRTIRIELRSGSPFADYGYGVDVGAHLTLTLT